MLDEITITKRFLTETYKISADLIADDKLDIKKEENSIQKYIKSLATLLNDCYYRGFLLDQQILKNLMDAIDYDNFANSIVESYREIIISNTYNSDYNRESKVTSDDLDKIKLEDLKQYILEYNEYIIREAKQLPVYCLKDEKVVKEYREEITMPRLSVVEDPIEYISSMEFVDNFINLQSAYEYQLWSYAMFRYRPQIFLNYCIRAENLFFLLNEQGNLALDILFDTIGSIASYKQLIDGWKYYLEFNDGPEFNDIIRKNMDRLFTYIKVQSEATESDICRLLRRYGFYGKEYNFISKEDLEISKYMKKCENKKYDKKTVVDKIEIFKDDILMIRQVLMSTDYIEICSQLIAVHDTLVRESDNNTDDLINIYKECIEGLANLHEEAVNKDLMALAAKLEIMKSSFTSEQEKELRNTIYDSLKNDK